MAQVNLKAAGDALVTNATNMAAQSGASLTAANLIAIGHMLALMDEQKGLGLPPILKLTPTDQAQVSTTT